MIYLNEFPKGNTKRDVNVLIEFIRIGEIDVMNDKYQAEINIEANWIINENIVNYDSSIHWNPMLYVENLITEIKQTIDYGLSYDEYNNLIITEYIKLKGVFWERLELENFPVMQSLNLLLEVANFRSFRYERSVNFDVREYSSTQVCSFHTI